MPVQGSVVPSPATATETEAAAPPPTPIAPTDPWPVVVLLLVLVVLLIGAGFVYVAWRHPALGAPLLLAVAGVGFVVRTALNLTRR